MFEPDTVVAMPSGLETASREELLALIGVLQDQNTHLREQIAELKADNERLTDRGAELERRLGRNSANSLLPPSSDRFQVPQKKPDPRAPANAASKTALRGSGCR